MNVQLELEDRHGAVLVLTKDGNNPPTLAVRRPVGGHVQGAVPQVELDEVDRGKLADWLRIL